MFAPEQIKIINFSANTAYKYTASRLSDMTHDANYNRMPMGAEIELNSVCSMYVSGYDTEPSTPDEKKAMEDFFKSDEARLFSFR